MVIKGIPQIEIPVGYFGLAETIQLLWPDSGARPHPRTFLRWRENGWVPYIKIGKSVYYDPQEVKRALDARFKVKEARA